MSSRQVILVNTSPPAERVYLLKSNIDNLPDDDVAEKDYNFKICRTSATVGNGHIG